MELGSLQQCAVEEQETTDIVWNKKGSDCMQGKTLYTTGTVKPQCRLPRQVVQSPTQEIFKTSLGKGLSNLFWPQAGQAFSRRLD